MDKKIDDVLKFDPIDTAEKMMGGDRSDASMFLGLALAMENNEQKERVLNASGDTHFSTTLDQYISIVQGIGFEQVLCIPFVGEKWGKETAPQEKFFVFFDKSRSILLTFDTYNSGKVNGGKFLYNIKPNNEKSFYNVISSGGYTKDSDGNYVWVGDHDCREAIKHKIARLEENGQFLTKWLERPFLWLLHYMDTKDKNYDYRAINAERIAMLPDYVQEAITPAQSSD